MKFNTRLPARFKVLAQISPTMYELIIESKFSKQKPFSLRSRTQLEVGASYMAAAGDGTFSSLKKVQDFAHLNMPVQELLALAMRSDYSKQLLNALLNSSSSAEYELLKHMLLRLLHGEIYIAALYDDLPLRLIITKSKITCEHYTLGLCSLEGNIFSAEFTCVQDLFNKFSQ